ncbi:J domain-containing protein [Pseudonocardia sp. C8]|uniref:J domain-containing protein n=1 Tax=Pseudonocardia sp. C8 TaxID=2762759 RepID=UPI0021046E83|nr:J domain-containing protein [Pseudonocardia sp. C8]
MPADRDIYAELGLSSDASAEQVRRAYRRLARQLHPDLNPDPAAHDQFAQVAAAYRVLADPACRARYDAARAACETSDGPDTGLAGTAADSSTCDDYTPAGEPVAYTDYTPADGYAPPPSPVIPPPVAPHRPPGPRAPAWAASRTPPPAPFPASWPTGRINHRRLHGRLLLAVWRLAPLPAHRIAASSTILAVLAAAGLAAAALDTLPVEATVIGGLSGIALTCWAIRALTLITLDRRTRRTAKGTR